MNRYNTLILFILLSLLSGGNATAKSATELMQQGNEAYNAGHYDAAIHCYENVLNAGLESTELYYNLGNAYYRQEEMGKAILNYERALRLKPGDRDTRENLALANSRTQDQIAVLPQFFLVRWYQLMVQWWSPQGWRTALLVILFCLCVCIATFALGRDYNLRKGTLIGAVVLTLLLIISIACCCSASRQYKAHQSAIVTQPLIVVKSAPEEGSVDKLVLHEGAKVRIDEQLSGWYRVQLTDGNNGWVASQDIERI